MKPKFLIFGVLILLVSTACSEDEQPHFQRIYSFGTLIDVTLYTSSEVEANNTLKEIEAKLDIMHQDWHAWRESSITKLNHQLQSGKPFNIDLALLPLVVQSKILYEQTNGLYNPVIGKLIELWGFYKDNPEANDKTPPVDAIKKLLKSNPSMSDIIIDGATVKGLNKDIQIDFGGYAKGYAVDKLKNYLRNAGIRNALINAGGDIGAMGFAGTRNWKIAIEDPENEKPLGWLEMTANENIFSSGNYRRKFETQGKSYHHIINPRTGFPGETATSVTVIHSVAAVADATATALMIANKEEWLTIAKNTGLTHFLIVDRDGLLYCDKLLADRLHLTNKARKLNILGEL